MALASSLIIIALIVWAIFDCSRSKALWALDGEVIWRQVVHADKTRTTVRSDAAHLAHSVALRTFNIYNHGITFMIMGALEQFMVQKPSMQSSQG